MPQATDLIDAIDRLSNSKGIVYLLLATQVLAVGPLAIFVATPDLFNSLPTSKLMLLSMSITLPQLTLGSAIYLAFRRDEPKDRRAAEGMLIACATMTAVELIAIGITWLYGAAGFSYYAWSVAAGIVILVLVERGEHSVWTKSVDSGAIIYDESDIREFIALNKAQFHAWKRKRQEDARLKAERNDEAEP